jgi:hypothetical protein
MKVNNMINIISIVKNAYQNDFIKEAKETVRVQSLYMGMGIGPARI